MNPARLVCVAVASLALAGSAATARADDDTKVKKKKERPSRFGVSADAGVPDGIMGALTLHVLPRVQIHAGAGHNSVAPGVRGGLRLFLLTSTVSPYLAVDGGHYFTGAGPGWADSIARQAGLGDAADVTGFSYDFGNAHVGLILGGPRAALFLQGGVSVIAADLDVRTTESTAMPDGPNGTIEIESKNALRVVLPAGRVGLAARF